MLLHRLVIASFIVLTACTSVQLPETKQFLDTSLALQQHATDVKSDINYSYEAMKNVLNAVDCDAPIQNHDPRNKKAIQNYEKQQQRLEKYRSKYENQEAEYLYEFEIRFVVIKAISDYASRLDGIVQSTTTEVEKIKAIHNALDTMFNLIEQNASKTGQYAPAVIAGSKLLKTVNTMVASIRADMKNLEGLTSLSIAVKKAGDAVDKFSVLMAKELPDNDSIESRIDAFNVQYKNCHAADYNFYQLLNEQREYLIHQYRYFNDAESMAQLNEMMQKQGVLLDKSAENLLAAINQQLLYQKPFYEALETKRLQTEQRLQKIPSLMRETIALIEQLVNYHQQLSQDIETGIANSGFSFDKLDDYVSQLKTTFK
ncbi:MAG: hypothetical protein WAX77_16590 [Methylococcaceae bacterium]